MAKKVKVLVRSRVKGLSKEDEAKFKVGKVVSIDRDGEHAHLIRDGVFQEVEGEDDVDPAKAGDGDGEPTGDEPEGGEGTTQRGSKLNQGGTAPAKKTAK